MTDTPMPDPPGGFTPTEVQELANLADDIASLRERITALTAAKDRLTAQLRDRLKVADQAYVVGAYAIKVTQTTRFDPAKAAQVIAPAVLPLVMTTTTVIDAAKAEALLPPAAFAACRSPYGVATVTVKEVKP
jgi:hypothetical protein